MTIEQIPTLFSCLDEVRFLKTAATISMLTNICLLIFLLWYWRAK